LLAIIKTKAGARLFDNLLISKPRIDASKCLKCGICIQICPIQPKSIDWVDGDKSQTPRHDHKRCIRCFCCQETCPEGAIFVKKPLLRKIFGKY